MLNSLWYASLPPNPLRGMLARRLLLVILGEQWHFLLTKRLWITHEYK